MSEGEHTIISKIPRERLNQIASRKLSALALAVRLGADRETLEGEMAFAGRIPHPITGQPLAKGRFVVAGHDHLRFVDPPLSALPPIPFFDAERVAQVEQRVGLALRDRAAGLQDLAARVRGLGIEAGIDSERLTVRAVVKTQSHAFELLGGPEGVRVSRVAPVGGRPFEVSPDFPQLQLGRFSRADDLAGHLVRSVEAMAAGPSVRRPPAEPGGGGPVAVTAPPRNAVTLETLSRAFGGEAMLAPNAALELIQEFQHGGTRYRFVAHREVGTAFRGRLIGPSGDVWSERFELAQFPGARRVVAAALGAPAEGGSGPLGDFPAQSGAGPVPQHLMPNPGEVWVMNVVVEQAGPEEVRYVGTDIDGRPYGAARVLKRSDFEAVFSSDRGGWRLLVIVDQVQGESVLYRQLDGQRQPIGAPRKMATAILAANFVPEAAAY